jgi:hypothetical protein
MMENSSACQIAPLSMAPWMLDVKSTSSGSTSWTLVVVLLAVFFVVCQDDIGDLQDLQG